MRFKSLFPLALIAAHLSTRALDVPPLPEMQPKSSGGLVLTVESAATKAIDVRHARMPALYVPEGSTITPFLPAGPFKATWSGELSVQLRDDYTFLAEGNGKLSVKIGDAVVLEASGTDFAQAAGKSVRLNKGKNKLTVLYESPEKGDAFLRLYWKGEEFPKEPLPIQRMSHESSLADIRVGLRLREGRELFGELRCTRCHNADGVPAPGAKGGHPAGALTVMPELDMDAPDLSEAGSRLKAPWITQWLKDPRKLRPESSMPQVLHGATAGKDAADIAAYIVSLGKADDKTSAPDEKLAAQGGGLIERYGCVGCHTMPDNPKIEAGRVPLRYVRAKWQEPALREFLKKPDAHYKWIRMPNFNFSEEEINKVVAFLLHSKIEDKSVWLIEDAKEAGDAARGKTLVQSTGCVNCHNFGAGVAGGLKAPALKIGETLSDSWAKGCVSAAPEGRGKAPDFHLTDGQRGALLAFAANKDAKKSLVSESMPEYAERQVRVLRCVACHQRDDQDDLWSRLEEEVAALKVEETHEPAPDANEAAEPHIVEQVRPKLMWIGEKLKPEWMADFIAGKTPYKLRTWLHAKMPGFQQRAGDIARGLAIEHGFKPVSPAEPEPNAEMAAAGRILISKNGGFSCTSCHSVGRAAAVGVFEAPGPNLMYVKSRLTKEYYHRWMREPLRVDPTTKMPAFAQSEKTQLMDHYEGDAHKQFEAIWQYLLAGEKVEPPEE